MQRYVAIWSDFVYVAHATKTRGICTDVIDAFARRIVGWPARRTGFVLDDLAQALHQRQPFTGGLVCHVDRRSQ